MPQIDFCIHPDETRQLVTSILESGMVFVPDLIYATPAHDQLVTSADVLRLLPACSHFFLLLPGVSGPLDMRRIDEGSKKGRYYIMPKHGGACVDILFPKITNRDDGKQVTSGFLAYYRLYWDPEANRNRAIPDELLSVYRSITKQIRKRAASVRGKLRKCYLFPQAARLLEEDNAFLVGFE